MDLQTLIENGLDESTAAKVMQLHEDDVGGLKAKASQLLEEKKTEAQKAAEASETARLAREEAAKAAEQKLMAEGKYEEAQQLREKERAEAIAAAQSEAKTAKEALESMHKERFLGEVLSSIDDKARYFARADLSSRLEVKYNDGKATVGIKDGDNIVSADDFSGWAAENEHYKNVLIGVRSSGTGAAPEMVRGGASPKTGDFLAAKAAEINAKFGK